MSKQDYNQALEDVEKALKRVEKALKRIESCSKPFTLWRKRFRDALLKDFTKKSTKGEKSNV